MDNLTAWIRRHQVLAFFIFTYAVTWPILFLYYFILPENQYMEIFIPLAIFSPALGAMLISGIAEPRPKQGSNKPRRIAFTLAWLVSAPILFLYGWKISEMELVTALIVWSIFALLPAWVLSTVYARTPGIRKHFSTLLKPRGPAIWYLVVFLIFPGIQLLGIGVTRLLGNEIEFHIADLGFRGAATFLVLEFCYGFIFTGGINEESGWRGFALPRLQARYPVIVAAGTIWFFWAFWHLPYDFGRGEDIRSILENRIIWNLVVAILMTWLYNRTNGSILAPALFHPAMNTFGNNLPLTPVTLILLVALAIFAIIFDQMWKKLPPEHLAVSKAPI